jgi:transcriptional regulator with XRE-family HTH domain
MPDLRGGNPVTSPTSARSRDLGERAARLRHGAGFTLQVLAEEMGGSGPAISRFEGGKRGAISEIRFIQYLTLCGLKSDDIMPLVELFRMPDNGYHVAGFDGGLPDELIALVVHETSAQTIQSYESIVVPGLLQSRDYIHGLFCGSSRVVQDNLDMRVQRRIDRQNILDREKPPGSVFFIGEGALHTIVGDRQVMHDQLMKLQFACDWDDCTIRVVPRSEAGRVGMISPFRLMTFAEHGPVAIQDMMTAIAFMEKPAHIAVYRQALEHLDQVALPAEQSGALITHLADQHSRMGAGHDERDTAGVVVDVAEE